MIKVIGVPLLTIQMALVAFAPEAGAQGSATATGDRGSAPAGAAAPAPARKKLQFNPEQLSRSVQPNSASPDGSTQPYILGPLWNPKSSTAKK